MTPPDSRQTKEIASRRAVSVIGVFMAAIYVAATMQHPIFNFDDLYLIYGFEKIPKSEWLQGARDIFLATDLPHEYRTYSVARVLQYVLWSAFGRQTWPYYLVISSTWAVCAALIYRIIERLEGGSGRLSPTAFGVAVIWLFSPFSICRTFHHWSYLILPMTLLLAYVSLTLADRARFARVVLIPLAALCGEAVIPALFTCIVLMNRRSPRRMAIEITVLVAVLGAHFALLHAVNGYNGENRFSFAPQGSIASLSYFLASIGATMGRAFQISVLSYEPYDTGLPVQGWAWHELSVKFAALVIVLVTLILAVWRIGDRVEISRRRIISIAVVIGSLWALYIVTTLSTKQHGMMFSLQVRSGYVVLPATLAFAFLLTQQGGKLLRAAGALIPLCIVVGWSLNMAVVQPAQAAVDRKIIRLLAQAHANGIKTVALWRPQKWSEETYVALNPYIITTDTPFQQSWTSGFYIFMFGGMEAAFGISGYEGNSVRLLAYGRVEFSCPVDVEAILKGEDSDRRPEALSLQRLAPPANSRDDRKCVFPPEMGR